MDYNHHITRDPNICCGQPIIRGNRVTLRVLLASLAEGASTQEVERDFATVTEADIRAVIAFAASSAEEDLPASSIPALS